MEKYPSAIRNLVIAVLLVSLGGVVGYRLGSGQNVPGVSQLQEKLTKVEVVNTQQPTEYKVINFAQFWEVWQTLEQQYLDPNKLKQDEMFYGAVKGMVASLGDPYTMYLPPVEQKRSTEDLAGAFFGVGIQLGYIDNVLAVQAPLKGSPAERAGVKAKDLILHVKDEKKGIDEDTQGWSLPDAVQKIRGERNTAVTLTLLRRDENQEPFQVTLERDEIVVPSVELSYVEKDGKKVAHITLSRFGDRTQKELEDIITDINKQSPKVASVVLDMRNNPGGYLDGAIFVASEFIKSGTVVTQKGRYTSQEYKARGTARLANYPVVVVVNGGSASAAEIVAGALRDRRKAELIGEKTFGKGTVQDALELDGGAGLHVTIARWLLPGGDWIHDTGIPVNTEVKDDPNTEQDEVLDKAVEASLK